MKLSEVVTTLRIKLPQLSSEFTDTVPMVSAVHASGVATVETAAAHGLTVGALVAYEGIKTVIPLASVVFDVPTLTAAFVTTLPHDITFGWEGSLTVELTGAGNGWDGTWPIVSSDNRTSFVLQFDSDLSSVSTVGLETAGIANVYNTLRGTFAVASLPTPTSLTVALPDTTGDLGTLDISEGSMRAEPRVTATADEETAFSSYDTDNVNGAQTWLYVVRGDNSVSRDRRTNLDSVATEQTGQDFQQWLRASFTILVATPAADQEAGRAAVDSMEDLRPPILRSVLGKRFSSGLSLGSGEPLQFVGDEVARYDGPVYWHAFAFEAIEQIQFEDTAGFEDTVAFRDITLATTIDIGQDLSEAGSNSDTIDLDKNP